MLAIIRNLWQFLIGHNEPEQQPPHKFGSDQPRLEVAPAVKIPPNDPLVAYFQSNPGAIELNKLNLDSPILKTLDAAGVRLVAPLVSRGELIGLINLGPRLSEQDYSTDDRRLLDNLASQATPAVRVAQLVRQQQAEALARERIEQELRVARLIQHSLLPKTVPSLPGWQVATYYQPAREVGGDFYDFLYFPDGRLGLVVGDVADKGVPAALVMATTRTLLRAIAQRVISPGQVLERVNNLLHPDIPPKMFVTCLYALLDPASGRLQFANAGHDLPYRRHPNGVDELRATGMPLGLLPDMQYEEKEMILAPGESVLFYSDGLVEAHNPQHEMFGFPRLQAMMAVHPGGAALIDFMITELTQFTGPGWEQEDDVTLVTLEYTISNPSASTTLIHPAEKQEPLPRRQWKEETGENSWQLLAEFNFPSEPGTERLIADQTVELFATVIPSLSTRRLERLNTAVAEATMNAMEHGNKYQPEAPVSLQLLVSKTALAVRITDRGGSQPILEPETPDLEAKLAERQSPRGWGLFLIKNMVDEMHLSSNETYHTIELILYLKGEENGDTSS
jgi:serine phosphatase RsbU (regulator of sigma subunit)/anti-sigma regulatory factor (Ser/Thr protein kinase)